MVLEGTVALPFRHRARGRKRSAPGDVRTGDYDWGMIPVEARIGSTRWTTSLFPKDGGYVVPLKDLVRNAERIAVGDTVRVRLAVDV